MREHLFIEDAIDTQRCYAGGITNKPGHHTLVNCNPFHLLPITASP
jgi:hypothetical protein